MEARVKTVVEFVRGLTRALAQSMSSAVSMAGQSVLCRLSIEMPAIVSQVLMGGRRRRCSGERCG